MTMVSPTEVRSACSGDEQEAVMSPLSIANPSPSERRVTGGILFLLAGLAALGALAAQEAE